MIAVLAALALAPGFAGCRAYTSPHPVFVARPASIVFSCGDGNLYATGLRC